ncbi:hypothetical protein K1T71_012684 [Dendrolimus kikuchii]|uniref:Uncharacterized protein n=1 Tax=Dendrolimus kikuchii TaxID=765133 RepID=A0ACC1CKF8_9NEOP|nr:hypothetical protein K1T71_012684 [Dendrolimus kikuchii]
MIGFGILLFVGLATANDLAVGPMNIGQKIYDEKKEASPAIWRQVHNVTINAINDEIINSINILDLRPEKDGEANIVEGGVGHQNVTIELKSPAVFRGYEFQIQAFAVPVSEYKGVLPEHKVSSIPTTPHTDISSPAVPVLIAKDLENGTRLVRKSDDKKPTSTEAVSTSTIKPEHPASNEQTPKIHTSAVTNKIEIKSINDIATTPKTPENDDELTYHELQLLTTAKPISTDVVEPSALPTTEEDALMIDINGQNPRIGNHYPPITHEEQGKRDGRDTQTSQTPAVTLAITQSTPNAKSNDAPLTSTGLSHPNPTIQTAKSAPTKQDVPTTTIATKEIKEYKTIKVTNEDNESDFTKYHDKQNIGIPLPYINH